MFTPLMPMFQSFIVLDEEDEDGDERVVSIPFSAKSMLTAWLRAAAAWGVLGGIGLAVSSGMDASWLMMGQHAYVPQLPYMQQQAHHTHTRSPHHFG
jgi:hypothetical protein